MHARGRNCTFLVKAEINADNPEKIEPRYIFATDWARGPEAYAK
jgi:hypothetical protein